MHLITHHVNISRVYKFIEFLAKHNISTRLHHSYKPDLGSSCNIYIFSKLKSDMKDHHYESVENLKKSVTDELKNFTGNDSK